MSTTFALTACPAECFYSPLAAESDLAELVEIFVSDLSDRVANIRRYAQFEDWSEVRRLAHQLKGAGGSYGFPHLSAAAEKLENAARRPSPADSMDEALAALATACERTKAGTPK